MKKNKNKNWLDDPKEVEKVESNSWPKWIKLLDVQNIEGVETIVPFKTKKIRKILKTDSYFNDKISDLTMCSEEGFMVDAKHYHKLKKKYGNMVILLGVDNGH